MATAMYFVTFLSVFIVVSGSAIPIWEYLSKDEKMAYLYNMFASQVEEVCNGPNFEECSKDLLKYGLKNLHDMPEDHLDTMDPYQRGANSMIWKSMMEGHTMMSKKEFTTPAPEQDIYDTFPESNFLGSASSRQDTVLNVNGQAVTRPVHYPYGSVFVLPESSTKTSHQAKQPSQASTGPAKSHYGPMVVKVHLDGRPVQEEKSLPADDDIHHHRIVKTKVPSLHSLERNVVYRQSPIPYAVYTRPGSR